MLILHTRHPPQSLKIPLQEQRAAVPAGLGTGTAAEQTGARPGEGAAGVGRGGKRLPAAPSPSPAPPQTGPPAQRPGTGCASALAELEELKAAEISPRHRLRPRQTPRTTSLQAACKHIRKRPRPPRSAVSGTKLAARDAEAAADVAEKDRSPQHRLHGAWGAAGCLGGRDALAALPQSPIPVKHRCVFSLHSVITPQFLLKGQSLIARDALLVLPPSDRPCLHQDLCSALAAR